MKGGVYRMLTNQQGFLKHLLQKPTANLRKPYGIQINKAF